MQQAKKRAAERPLEHSVPGAVTSPSGRAMRAEGALRIEEALADLPERQAEAVRLRYLEGLSVAETCERMDCTEPAVKLNSLKGMDPEDKEKTIVEVVHTIRGRHRDGARCAAGGGDHLEGALLLLYSALVNCIRQPVSTQDIDALTSRVESKDKAVIIRTLIKARQKAAERVEEHTGED